MSAAEQAQAALYKADAALIIADAVALIPFFNDEALTLRDNVVTRLRADAAALHAKAKDLNETARVEAARLPWRASATSDVTH